MIDLPRIDIVLLSEGTPSKNDHIARQSTALMVEIFKRQHRERQCSDILNETV
jgi:hypothetical protein